MPTIPEAILGPFGALVLAVAIGWVVGRIALRFINMLWEEHRASDADVKAQRDAAVDRLERVIGLAEKADKP